MWMAYLCGVKLCCLSVLHIHINDEGGWMTQQPAEIFSELWSAFISTAFVFLTPSDRKCRCLCTDTTNVPVCGFNAEDYPCCNSSNRLALTVFWYVCETWKPHLDFLYYRTVLECHQTVASQISESFHLTSSLLAECFYHVVRRTINDCLLYRGVTLYQTTIIRFWVRHHLFLNYLSLNISLFWTFGDSIMTFSPSIQNDKQLSVQLSRATVGVLTHGSSKSKQVNNTEGAITKPDTSCSHVVENLLSRWVCVKSACV